MSKKPKTTSRNAAGMVTSIMATSFRPDGAVLRTGFHPDDAAAKAELEKLKTDHKAKGGK